MDCNCGAFGINARKFLRWIIIAFEDEMMAAMMAHGMMKLDRCYVPNHSINVALGRKC